MRLFILFWGHRINFQAGPDRRKITGLLWALAAPLIIALEMGIFSLHVFGDSKLVIGWVSGNYRLQNLILQTCYHQIHLMLSKFTAITFKFQHNTVTYGLSEQALVLKVGSMNLMEATEGGIPPTVTRSTCEWVFSSFGRYGLTLIWYS